MGVMGGDSCSEGRGFESQHSKLDAHLSALICWKTCNVENKKINEKEARMAHLKTIFSVT